MALPAMPGVRAGPRSTRVRKRRRSRDNTGAARDLLFLESSVTRHRKSAVDTTDPWCGPEAGTRGWGFLGAWGRRAGVARKVTAEWNRGRDACLFPTRFLSPWLALKLGQSRQTWDHGWLAVARLPTSYLQHTRTGSTLQTARTMGEPHTIQMPTLVPADLPSPHPARVEAVGTSAVAPCPRRAVRPWLALLPRWEQLGRLSADVRPRRVWGAPGTPAGPPALNRTGKPARDPTCLLAGSSMDRRAVGWTLSWGRAWGQSVRSPGTRGSEMRHVSIQMLDWKPSPSTWCRAPQDGPTTAPNRGARSQKSSFRKMRLKSSSNENPRSEGQGGHWRPDHGWQ